MATTGCLALFGVLPVFVFGLIVLSTDGNGNSILQFRLYVPCSSVCTTYDLGACFCITIPLYFLSGRHTVYPFLKGFKLVALCYLLKFCCCLFLIFFCLFCSCDMLGSCGFIICRVVGIVVLNFLPVTGLAECLHNWLGQT